MIKALLIAGALALMPAAALAQPAAAPGTVATATRLLEAQKVQGPLDKMLQQLIPVVADSTLTALEKAPNVPVELKTLLANPAQRSRANIIIGEEVLKSFRARYADVQAAAAREYAAAFSEADLQAMLAFFQSPTGQRWVDAQGGLQDVMSKEGQKMGASAAQEALPVALERIVKLGAAPGK